MSIIFRKRRLTIIAVAAAVFISAALLPFINASCNSQRQDEAAALERLRAATRFGLTPAESVTAAIETQHAGTTAGALARVLRARARIEARDFAGAAALLEARDIARLTLIGDYALLLRAQALAETGKRVEARAAYEQLAREYSSSRLAREATLRGAELAMAEGGGGAVPTLVKALTDANDARALLLAAKASDQQNDSTRALAFYRRLYFYAAASEESAEVPAALGRLGSTTAPASAEEALTRADKLFAGKRFAEAADAYTDAFARFTNLINTRNQLRRGVAFANARRVPEAAAALNAIPASEGETRAEAIHHLALLYARTRAWDKARSTVEEMRRTFPQSAWTRRALVAAGQTAKDAKNTTDANYFFRAAVSSFPGASEGAPAQFDLAWQAHEANNFQESSRLLVEHLAEYADENTDFRGRAGYWAARDSERAGQLAEARAIYEGMQARYSANWYGYLAKSRLDALASRGSSRTTKTFVPDSPIGRAVAHLRPVTVAEETVGAEANAVITKADQLSIVGLDDPAHEEIDRALENAPTSPRLNLAKARIFRSRDKNLEAFNVLRRSFPDYAQMLPEELTREEWDVFYPLAHWEIITREARAKNLDPYIVAGLIRQESVFNPRAASTANAYGLMQLLVPTGRLVAKRYGVDNSITRESLFDPRLNIQLGTGYLRDNFDKFGRLEYVAAAYNAGPGRAVQWRASLPLEIDEWAEAIPFKETRGYVQGVVRNMLQYRRLYDEGGRFRPEVGTRAARTSSTTQAAPAMPVSDNVRPRRAIGNEED
ncbi:MAG: transglycosylase SLT domain-containing protein [Pyrinomonadaceae bacterium]